MLNIPALTQLSLTSRRSKQGRREAGLFGEDVCRGLSQNPKTLPCKYFYDETGSRLFDEICELEEYYPTRTELSILTIAAEDIARSIGPNVRLVEYGSGSSVKTRILLDNLDDLACYVPVDISSSYLLKTAANLAADYPQINIRPAVADFTRSFRLPVEVGRPQANPRTVIFFPGSTIGNFTPNDALGLLERMANQVGPGGGLLLGIDLRKDESILTAAYNDRENVTARFNLNLLDRINRELGGTFEVGQFRHLAVYQRDFSRVEMRLISCRRQFPHVLGQVFPFEEGEYICTEHSHKYTVDGMAKFAAQVGFRVRKTWVDNKNWFAVILFECS